MTAPGTVLLDFDGTITRADVGNRLLHRLSGGAIDRVVDSWKQGGMGSRECLIRECALARGTREDVLAFAGAQPVDPGVGPFLESARRYGWTVRVVSDGLDVYIRAILEREGWDVPVETNRAWFAGDRILPAFPYAGRGCGRCGTCKGGAVEAAAPPVVFVGNGLSDRCAAGVADRLYAKDDLARHCDAAGIPYEPYTGFADIERSLFGAHRGATGTDS